MMRSFVTVPATMVPYLRQMESTIDPVASHLCSVVRMDRCEIDAPAFVVRRRKIVDGCDVCMHTWRCTARRAKVQWTDTLGPRRDEVPFHRSHTQGRHTPFPWQSLGPATAVVVKSKFRSRRCELRRPPTREKN
jgi:hypothetical protein